MNVLLAVCGSMATGPNLISMLRDIHYVAKIIGIDIDSENPGKFLVDNFHQAPKTDSKDYIPFVKNVCKIRTKRFNSKMYVKFGPRFRIKIELKMYVKS